MKNRKVVVIFLCLITIVLITANLSFGDEKSQKAFLKEMNKKYPVGTFSASGKTIQLKIKSPSLMKSTNINQVSVEARKAGFTKMKIIDPESTNWFIVDLNTSKVIKTSNK